ncbi:MAG: hypothetical protein ACI9T7_003699 [Oleiphilaceae bacterium]|jgi:hypothetical protein
MKNLKIMKVKNVALGLFVAASIYSASVFAATEDECAAWICAAGSFAPAECKPPFNAMMKRIKKLKPPLPAISSCPKSKENSSLLASLGVKESQMSHNYGAASIMPSGANIKTPCIHYGGDDGEWTPHGCVSGRFIEVFIEGEQEGDTYFW